MIYDSSFSRKCQLLSKHATNVAVDLDAIGDQLNMSLGTAGTMMNKTLYGVATLNHDYNTCWRNCNFHLLEFLFYYIILLCSDFSHF